MGALPSKKAPPEQATDHESGNITTRSTDNATTQMPESAMFYQLPNEVLAIISDMSFGSAQLREGGHNLLGARQLAALRLAHRRFAHLEPLLATMFETIVLRPRARTIAPDWTYLGRYVKEVVFGSDYKSFAVDILRAEVSLAAELMQFSRLRSVSISRDDEDSPDSGFPTKEEIILFAMRCLSRAGTRPEKLSLFDITDDLSNGAPMDSIRLRMIEEQKTILSSVTRLNIVEFGIEEDCPLEFPESILMVLGSCASNLAHLSIEIEDTRCRWPPAGATMSLPQLKSCRIKHLNFDPSDLAAGITRCPKLEEVRLNSAQRYDFEDADVVECKISDLRPIFDALRNHPNRMLVDLEFDELVNPWFENDLDYESDSRTAKASMDYFALIHHTGTGADHQQTASYPYRSSVIWPLQPTERARQLYDTIDVLKDYISGRGDWAPLDLEYF